MLGRITSKLVEPDRFGQVEPQHVEAHKERRERHLHAGEAARLFSSGKLVLKDENQTEQDRHNTVDNPAEEHQFDNATRSIMIAWVICDTPSKRSLAPLIRRLGEQVRRYTVESRRYLLDSGCKRR
jgi:hypothetical protein